MITRHKVLIDAINRCMKEIYSYAQPHVTWEDFIEENKKFLEKEEKYYSLPEDKRPSYQEYMGPKPYEFYYLPKDVLKEIADSYVYAYKLNAQQNLLDIIEILKNYCKEPVVDKYIEEYTDEEGNYHPGYRGYEHPINLEKKVAKVISQYLGEENGISTEISKEVCNKFFEFLDMAGDFYSWNSEINAFNTEIYLGPSPHSAREKVIENWKKYRNTDIEIDSDEQIMENWYGN